MYIHQAAHKALVELGCPTHIATLYRYIDDNGYYNFGAKDPENALAIQLSRRSTNVVIGNSSPEKSFYRAAPATYGLIEWLDGSASHGDIVNNIVHDDVVALLRNEGLSTEKEQLVLARIGQGRFRDDVFALWGNRCAVTGSAWALRASHIKPWRLCNSVERLDPQNGLPLVATLDSLFDAHLISFTFDGSIVISETIPEHEQRCLGIDADMRLRQTPRARTQVYLQGHRESA